jgi:hypothetical protein
MMWRFWVFHTHMYEAEVRASRGPAKSYDRWQLLLRASLDITLHNTRPLGHRPTILERTQRNGYPNRKP